MLSSIPHEVKVHYLFISVSTGYKVVTRPLEHGLIMEADDDQLTGWMARKLSIIPSEITQSHLIHFNQIATSADRERSSADRERSSADRERSSADRERSSADPDLVNTARSENHDLTDMGDVSRGHDHGFTDMGTVSRTKDHGPVDMGNVSWTQNHGCTDMGNVSTTQDHGSSGIGVIPRSDSGSSYMEQSELSHTCIQSEAGQTGICSTRDSRHQSGLLTCEKQTVESDKLSVISSNLAADPYTHMVGGLLQSTHSHHSHSTLVESSITDPKTLTGITEQEEIVVEGTNNRNTNEGAEKSATSMQTHNKLKHSNIIKDKKSGKKASLWDRIKGMMKPKIKSKPLAPTKGEFPDGVEKTPDAIDNSEAAASQDDDWTRKRWNSAGDVQILNTERLAENHYGSLMTRHSVSGTSITDLTNNSSHDNNTVIISKTILEYSRPDKSQMENSRPQVSTVTSEALLNLTPNITQIKQAKVFTATSKWKKLRGNLREAKRALFVSSEEDSSGVTVNSGHEPLDYRDSVSSTVSKDLAVNYERNIAVNQVAALSPEGKPQRFPGWNVVETSGSNDEDDDNEVLKVPRQSQIRSRSLGNIMPPKSETSITMSSSFVESMSDITHLPTRPERVKTLLSRLKSKRSQSPSSEQKGTAGTHYRSNSDPPICDVNKTMKEKKQHIEKHMPRLANKLNTQISRSNIDISTTRTSSQSSQAFTPQKAPAAPAALKPQKRLAWNIGETSDKVDIQEVSPISRRGHNRSKSIGNLTMTTAQTESLRRSTLASTHDGMQTPRMDKAKGLLSRLMSKRKPTLTEDRSEVDTGITEPSRTRQSCDESSRNSGDNEPISAQIIDRTRQKSMERMLTCDFEHDTNERIFIKRRMTLSSDLGEASIAEFHAKKQVTLGRSISMTQDRPSRVEPVRVDIQEVPVSTMFK